MGREQRAHLDAARRLSRTLDARQPRLDFALAAARMAERAEDSRRVLDVLAVVERDLSAGRFDSEWEVETLRARGLRDLGDLPAAAAAGSLAVAAVEWVRGTLGSGQLRTTYLAERARTYTDLVSVLVELGALAQAFEIGDAVRGRTLLEHLAMADTDDVPEIVGPIARTDTILHRIQFFAVWVEDLEATSPHERDSATTNELAQVRAQLADARRAFEARRIEAAETVGPRTSLLGASTLPLLDIQHSLRPDEILIQYLLAPEQLLIFVVTRDTVVLTEQPVTSRDITGRVRFARELLDARGAGADRLGPVLEDLYELLIEPVQQTKPLDGVGHVIVVPHGALTYLPFAALRDRATGRYLIEDHAVTLLPTASALPVLRNAERPPPQRMRVEAFAPLPDELPATATEARAVAGALPGSRVRLGRRATEARVRTALAEDRIVHLATHGVFNAASPMFSRIELFPGRGRGGEDGLLEVHEVLGLHMRAPLVFLSGCETGLGLAGIADFVPGEDYINLAQAFLFAGASNVIATLWRIEDAGGAAFAEAFYGALAVSGSFEEALRAGQRQMISNTLYGAPYYWAGYQLIGSEPVSESL